MFNETINLSNGVVEVFADTRDIDVTFETIEP